MPKKISVNLFLTFALVPILSFHLATAQGALIEVTTPETPVYSNIGAHETDARLFRGSIVEATETKDDWYHVRLRNGVEGWIPKWVCREVPARIPIEPAFPENFTPTVEKPAYATVIVDKTALRSIPYGGLQAKRDVSRVGTLAKGTVVKVTEAIFHWLRVELSPWETGWVYDEALRPATPEELRSPSAQITSARFQENTSSWQAEFSLSHPAPFIINSSTTPSFVRFNLYSIDCEHLPDDFLTPPT